MRATKTGSRQYATKNDYNNTDNCLHFDVKGVQLNTSIEQFIFNIKSNSLKRVWFNRLGLRGNLFAQWSLVILDKV